MSEELVSVEDQKSWHEDDLVAIFDEVIKDAEFSVINNLLFLNLFDIDKSCTAGELWKKLYDRVKPEISYKHQKTLEFILEQGSLSTRILNVLDGDLSEKKIQEIYSRLGECLAHNKLFKP